MIFDKIENANLYKGINTLIARALTYIETTNLANLTLGRHEIDGDNLFAVVSEYFTKEKSNDLMEAHCRYIDLQYLIEGFENIGVTTYTNQQAVKSYNKEDDYLLYKESYHLVSLQQGMFAIFFPDDIHLPGIISNNITKIKKIVIKIKI